MAAGDSSRAAAMTCESIGRPATFCSTLGSADFMRLPSPAARMTTWSALGGLCSVGMVRPWAWIPAPFYEAVLVACARCSGRPLLQPAARPRKAGDEPGAPGAALPRDRRHPVAAGLGRDGAAQPPRPAHRRRQRDGTRERCADRL